MLSKRMHLTQIKRLLIILNLLLANNAYSQEISIAEIDHALDYKTEQLIGDRQIWKAISLNKKLVDESKKKGYKRGEFWANVNLGRSFGALCKLEESFKYLHIAKLQNNVVSDFYVEAIMFAIYGRNLNALRLTELSNKNFNKAITICQKIKDRYKQKSILSFIYGWKAYNFIIENRNKNKDSIYSYFNKSYHIYPNPDAATDLCKYFLEYDKNTDSAETYLQRADSLFNSGVDPFLGNRGLIYEYSGSVHYVKKDYHKALEYYKRALSISLKGDNVDDDRDYYKLISQVYTRLNDEQQASEYFEKYSHLNDSLQMLDRKAVDFSVDQFIDEREQESDQSNTSFYFTIIGLILLSLGIIIWVCLYYRKTKIRLIDKNKILLEKERESNILRNKTTNVSEEVSQLAKDNDPLFLVKFQDLYPGFCEKLLAINPRLSVADLTLCALIKLNFSSKDIACFTFVQLNTIHVKKYRLKKKLGIPEETLLHNYLKTVS